VLARWIELGEKPATQYRRFFGYYLLCFLFSFTWLYQGLVPKVLMKHPLEIDMLMKLSPLTYGQASTAIFWVGILEMMIGLVFLMPKMQPLLLKAQILVFPLLTLSAIIAAF